MSGKLTYIFFGALLAVLLLVNCSSDDSTAPAEDKAITLAAKVNTLTTRAGQTGIMDYEVLTTTGFGVFAESTNTNYSGWLNNTQVTYYGNETNKKDIPGDIFIYPGNWTYGTTKYWPKDNTAISFYAYAPYTTNFTGTGITTVGNKTVEYAVAATPDAGVDLLWGVNGETGFPWENATLESTGGPILITFQHALSGVSFNVQTNIDDHQIATADNVTVTVSKITMAPKSGSAFFENGTLNLDNPTEYTPNWTTKNETEAIQNIELSTVTIGTPSGLFMLIPDEQKDYTVTVEYNVTYKNTNNADVTLDYTGNNAGKATLSSLALNAGIKYQINLLIGLTTFDLDVTATDWEDTPQPVNVTIEYGTSANSSLAKERQ